jgi:hypothetical protein
VDVAAADVDPLTPEASEEEVDVDKDSLSVEVDSILEDVSLLVSSGDDSGFFSGTSSGGGFLGGFAGVDSAVRTGIHVYC